MLISEEAIKRRETDKKLVTIDSFLQNIRTKWDRDFHISKEKERF